MKTGREVVIVETGTGAAAANIAIDRRWLVEHAQNLRPNLLRLYRNLPAVVLGQHQAALHEVRSDYCERQGIAIARRLTGGGALYVDERQLAWSLIVHRPRKWRDYDIAALLKLCCSGIGNALRRLGLDARFKAPNDLEIDGRKIASGYVTAIKDSLLFHGTILCDVDIARTLQALRVPTEKLSPQGLAGARQRLTTLKEQLGAQLPTRKLKQALVTELLATAGFVPRNATKSVYAILRASQGEQPDGEFPHGTAITRMAEGDFQAEALWKCPGALVRARLGFDADRRRLASVSITGDMFTRPADLLYRFEQWLQGTALADIENRAAEFFSTQQADMPGVSPQDLLRALRLALNRLQEQQAFQLTQEQANRLMVLGAAADLTASQILPRTEVVLVPYCAKPVDCAWRNRTDCPECGRCEVGEAYRLGRMHGLRVITINNYEHLCATLTDLRNAGVGGLIGMCCQNFFIKRNQAFKESGIPMVLMDISGSNCYELGQEEQAYAGNFQAQARLDVPLLRRIIRHIPKTDASRNTPRRLGRPATSPALRPESADTGSMTGQAPVCTTEEDGDSNGKTDQAYGRAIRS